MARANSTQSNNIGVSGWLVAIAVTKSNTRITAARVCSRLDAGRGSLAFGSGSSAMNGLSRESRPRRTSRSSRLGMAGRRASHRKITTSTAR